MSNLDDIPTYPSEYDPTGVTNNPPGSDSRKQGDDQFRILKANMNQTWANVAGAVTASHEELNTLTGVSTTDPIITFPSGTIMVFEAPATAPTGWVKKTDAAYDDVAMRIATGTLTQGGTHAFSVLFADLAEGANPGVAGHILTISETAAHNHGGATGSHSHRLRYRNIAANQTLNQTNVFGDETGSGDALGATPASSNNTEIIESSTASISSQGGGVAHSHGFDNQLKYRDVYFAEKS